MSFQIDITTSPNSGASKPRSQQVWRWVSSAALRTIAVGGPEVRGQVVTILLHNVSLDVSPY